MTTSPAKAQASSSTSPSPGERVARFLDRLAVFHGLPEEIVMDNGPEMTSKAMFLRSLKTGVRLRFI